MSNYFYFMVLLSLCLVSHVDAQEQKPAQEQNHELQPEPAPQQVADPTRPLHFSASNPIVEGAQETIQLTSILISRERKLAIINGETLTVNQTVKGVGAIVKRIDAEAVTLEHNGKVWRVLLNNTAIRK